MKTILISCIAAGGLLATAPAGTITGAIRAEGKPQAESSGGDGKYDSRKYKFVERVNYGDMRDFVVYIEGPMAEKAAPAPPVSVRTKRIAQKGAMFTPHVLPVVVGTTVEWPNDDEIFHNVFSMSDPKPFDLDLYKGNPPDKRVTFDKEGRVDVFCSIHAQMHCIVLVLPNPHFAVADERGHYSITNIPAGTYRLKAWHERLPAQVREITVTDDGTTNADFVLGITNLPKY